MAPSLSVNLYADDVLADSRDVLARIREAGPVVWLPRHRMYAIGRFADVRAALRNDAVYRSGAGVAANRLSNHLGRHSTLFSDDEARTRRRKVLMRSLAAKALVDIEPQVDARADALIERLLATDWFEAATDFSAHLPIGVVAELVGGPEGGERLLRWAAATFDALGPMNRPGLRSARTSLGLLLYTLRFSTAGVPPRSWAAAVFDARDRGQITTRQARGLVIDFVGPSLDTTILASTHLLWVFSRHPDVWDESVADPSLIPAAVVENVRIASPIRGFTRRLSRDHEIDGTPLPQGSRVVLLFGAANLDETRFPNPES
ncbi:MAG: cytochrome P450 [Streptosporangiaceae bacterium]